jgi:ABC-type transport system substrate-binding protein
LLHLSSVGLALVMLAGCASPAPSAAPSGQASAPTAGKPVAPKRIVAAILSQPATFSSKLNSANAAGTDALEEMVNADLSVMDDHGTLRPELAEAVPSAENGLWKVFPDGRMETTWKIRPGVKWHDGTPLTADDLVYTTQVERDRDLAAFRSFELIRGGSDPTAFRTLRSSEVRSAASSYTGMNYSGYNTPEFDALIERYATTIPRQERQQAEGQILHQMTDQMVVLGRFYDTEATAVNSRLLGATARNKNSTQSWNVHLWDVAS